PPAALRIDAGNARDLRAPGGFHVPLVPLVGTLPGGLITPGRAADLENAVEHHVRRIRDGRRTTRLPPALQRASAVVGHQVDGPALPLDDEVAPAWPPRLVPRELARVPLDHCHRGASVPLDRA